MKNSFKTVLFVIVICVSVANCDDLFDTKCKTNNYTDLNNTQIDVLKYCSNKLCIEKCCGEDEILFFNDTCMSKTAVFNEILEGKRPDLEAKVKFSNNILSFPNGGKISKKNFILIRNHRDVGYCTLFLNYIEYNILKDGTFRRQDEESEKWNDFERLKYCIDFKLIFNKTAEKPNKLQVQIAFRPYRVDTKDEQKIRVFEQVALAISSFFLLLVFVVYCLLPNLRNLTGRILMAYTITLLFTFILKWVINFYINDPPPNFCKTISPFLYFTALSSFFWYNVLSYDVWRGLRGHQMICNQIDPRSERVKFIRYCLYAWGAPLLMTAIVVALDNIDLSKTNVLKPPFNCLFDDQRLDFYFKIPIGILIFINTVLFFLTVYYIWKVNRAISKCQDARISAVRANRFCTYVKLSVIMGVNWCLELIRSDSIFWLYVLTNLYNLLAGVAIFFLFVCKKQILINLCKKFNIRNDFTMKLEFYYNKLSVRTATTSNGSSVKNSSRDKQLDPSQNKEEETGL